MRLDKNGALQCLGLTFLASAADVKKAYRTLALRWHPDKCREVGAKERFQQVDEAYKFLQDLDLPGASGNQAKKKGPATPKGASQTYEDIFAEMTRARQEELLKKAAEQAQAKEREIAEEKVRMQTPHLQLEFLAARFKQQMQEAENCGRPHDRQGELAAAGQSLVTGMRKVCELIQQKQDFALLKKFCRAAISQTIEMKSELILTKARQDLCGLVTSLCRHMFQHLDPLSSAEELSSLCDLMRDIVSEIDPSPQLPLYYSQCLLAYYKTSFGVSSKHELFSLLDQQFNNLTAKAGIWRLSVFAQYVQSMRAEASEDRQNELAVAEFMLLLRALAMMYQFSAFTADFEGEIQRMLSRLAPLFRSPDTVNQALVQTKVKFSVGGWNSTRVELQAEYTSISEAERGGLLIKVFLFGMKRAFEHYCTFSAKHDGYTVGQLVGFAKRESDFYRSAAPVFQLLKQIAISNHVLSLSVLSWLRHKPILGEAEPQWIEGLKNSVKVVVAILPESYVVDLMSVLLRRISVPAVVSKLLRTCIASVTIQDSAKLLFASRLFGQVSCAPPVRTQVFTQILIYAFNVCLKDNVNASNISQTLISQCTAFSLVEIHEVIMFIISSLPTCNNSSNNNNDDDKQIISTSTTTSTSSTCCFCSNCDPEQTNKKRMIVCLCNHAIETKINHLQQQQQQQEEQERKQQSPLDVDSSSKKEGYFFTPSLLVCAFRIGESALESQLNRLLAFDDTITQLLARDFFAGAKELASLHTVGSLLLINRCIPYLSSISSSLCTEAVEISLCLIVEWESKRRETSQKTNKEDNKTISLSSFSAETTTTTIDDNEAEMIEKTTTASSSSSLICKLTSELSLEKQLSCIQNRAVSLSLFRVIELAEQLQLIGSSAEALTLLNSCLTSLPAYCPLPFVTPPSTPIPIANTPLSFASLSKPRVLSSPFSTYSSSTASSSSSSTTTSSSSTTTTAATIATSLTLSPEQETVWRSLSLTLSLAKRCSGLRAQVVKIAAMKLDPDMFFKLAKFLFDDGAFRECVHLASACLCSCAQLDVAEQVLPPKLKLMDVSLSKADDKSELTKQASNLQDQCLSLLVDCFRMRKSTTAKSGETKSSSGSNSSSDNGGKGKAGNTTGEKTKTNVISKTTNMKEMVMQDSEVKQIVGSLCVHLTKVDQWVVLCEGLTSFPAALLHVQVVCVQRMQKGCEVQASTPLHISNMETLTSASRSKIGAPPSVAMFQLSWCPHQRCHSAACVALHLALLSQLKQLRSLVEGTALQAEWNQCLSMLGIWTKGKQMVHSELVNLKLKPPLSYQNSLPRSVPSSLPSHDVSSPTGHTPSSIMSSSTRPVTGEKASLKSTNEISPSFSDLSDNLWTAGQTSHTPRPAPGTPAARLFNAMNRNVAATNSDVLLSPKPDLVDKLKIGSMPVPSPQREVPSASSTNSLKRSSLEQSSALKPKVAKTGGGSLSALLERTKARVKLY